MAFDPSSSFALWGRDLGSERGGEGGGKGESQDPLGSWGQGREIMGYRAFCSFKYESMSWFNSLTWPKTSSNKKHIQKKFKTVSFFDA